MLNSICNRVDSPYRAAPDPRESKYLDRGATRFLNYYVLEMLLMKYTIFSFILVDIEINATILMPRRVLGTLKNLGEWAISTTKRTYLEKIKKGIARTSGKENARQVCHLTHADVFSHPIAA